VRADFTDRGSEFTSAVCVAVCDRAGAAAFHRPLRSCLDNAVAESLLATLKASSSTASITAPAPQARASIFRCGGERVTDHLPVAGIAGGDRTVTDPSAPRGRPPSTRSPPGRKPKERTSLLGQAATRRALNLAAAS